MGRPVPRAARGDGAGRAAADRRAGTPLRLPVRGAHTRSLARARRDRRARRAGRGRPPPCARRPDRFHLRARGSALRPGHRAAAARRAARRATRANRDGERPPCDDGRPGRAGARHRPAAGVGMSTPRPVVTGTLIVGGGITGLAAAERLAESGAPFVLVESSPWLGGKIATERVNGLVIEGGPDCFLAAKPAGLALVRSLGLTERLRGTDPSHRRTYVRRGGRLHELPEGLTGLVPSRIAPLLKTRVLSPLGRLRAGCEVLLPGRKTANDESIAQFVTRRFGAEAYDWLVEPLLSGIFAGDGAALSLAATFPQLASLEREQGSVLRAMLRRSPPRSAGSSNAPTGFVTPAGGLGELVDALMARLPIGAVS